MATSASHILFANALKSEKDLFWQDNASIPEAERQRQWAVKTADIASLCMGAPQQQQHASATTTPKPSPKPRQRRGSVGLSVYKHPVRADFSGSKPPSLSVVIRTMLRPLLSKCHVNAPADQIMDPQQTVPSSAKDLSHRWRSKNGS